MTNIIKEPSGWFFVNGEIYIISDFPGAEQRMKEHPELQAKTLAELEQIAVREEIKEAAPPVTGSFARSE